MALRLLFQASGYWLRDRYVTAGEIVEVEDDAARPLLAAGVASIAAPVSVAAMEQSRKRKDSANDGQR